MSMPLITLFGNLSQFLNIQESFTTKYRQYRRETLYNLNYDLNLELDYMDTFAEENPKNYQIWFHRRAIVEKLGDASRELAFTAHVFDVDAKNYHAWSHRYLSPHPYTSSEIFFQTMGHINISPVARLRACFCRFATGGIRQHFEINF